ncbi:11978_t:CDS:1, partial [Ambispora leptoticha]
DGVFQRFAGQYSVDKIRHKASHGLDKQWHLQECHKFLEFNAGQGS